MTDEQQKQNGHGGRRKNSGRKKGSENRATVEWKTFGQILLSRGTARALEILDSEPDDKFMDHFIQLVKFFRTGPKLPLDAPESNEPWYKQNF